MLRDNGQRVRAFRAGSRGVLVAFTLLLLCPSAARGQLNENCTVSVLNRTVRVNPDGTWVLPNIPANFGPVKARATCVKDGVTTSGESEFFTVAADGSVDIPRIVLGSVSQVPTSLVVAPATLSLTTAGQTTQLSVVAAYPDGSTRNVTAAGAGTSYTTSNPAIATVSPDGVVTAVGSGTVVIQATNDGAAGIVRAGVVLSNLDSDSDGIPDEAEVSLGLDPRNPVDAQEDFDRDNLINLREHALGSNLRNPDTDGDDLPDGDEVNRHQTNPVLADTDGEGVPDGVEVRTGSNPLDPNSLNLAKALRSIEVTPARFTLVVNTIVGEASRQLTVTGNLIDGKTKLNLTARSRGTNYNSSSLTVANFGGADGLVFGGGDGTATITALNNGFTATSRVTVSSFAPAALSFVAIPGFANNVDVAGNFAYVAAGSAGLQVVDVTDRRAPRIVGALDTPGNANDVRVVGNRAYVADGASGLRVIDVSNPAAPAPLGALDTFGGANDVVVVGDRAYVADGASGLQIIDVSDPRAPARLGVFDTPGTARGIDVSGNVAVVADGGSLRTVDVSNPASPAALGSVSTTDARDVAVDGNVAFLADNSGSLKTIDISNPAAPRLLASTTQSLGGILLDVVKAREFVLGADVFFVNGVPIVNVANPASPVARARLDFPARDDNGTGVAVDNSFVYLTADQSIQDNGVSGNSRLYIGQYLAAEDRAGVAPSASVTSPAAGATVIAGTKIPVTVTAADDVQVAAVDLLANGQAVSTDSSAPYQFELTVPSGVTSLALSAAAVDIAGNVGVSPEVRLSVIADPLTTVTGRVVDKSASPLAGANVSTLGRAAVTGPDGTFSIAGVPTVQGNLAVSASFTQPDGRKLVGSSAAFPPVPSGTTSVGDIVASNCLPAPSVYYGYNPNSQGGVILLGFEDNTTYEIINLGNNTAVSSGTLNKGQSRRIELGAVRHFKVAASAQMSVYLGHDCCNFGGSFNYPAADGVSHVGREFTFVIPVLSGSNEFVIFAHEAATVTIRGANGNTVTTQSLAQNGYWRVNGPPLAAGTTYNVTSTGNIALQSSAGNGNAAITSASGRDVGRSFLFATYNWSGGAFAVYAYEDTTFTLTNLDTGQVLENNRTLGVGQRYFRAGLGRNPWKL